MKGNKTPEEAGMPLIKKPKRPNRLHYFQKYVSESKSEWETISFYGKFWNELIKMKKKRILSGLQPSGKLHIGNYFGMMKRMIKYQDENDLFCLLLIIML